ncbi:hypothetical protein SAMN02745716_0004 [Thermoleophilum album]|uniref:Uncharacterized protein n=1 Tax=Thermoleophilum album TaxID=29539 RepID=A0A1H6FJ38_THEAL|nr:hypothetical protein SAMN02745716_0004 [Thermoleophilum album]
MGARTSRVRPRCGVPAPAGAALRYGRIVTASIPRRHPLGGPQPRGPIRSRERMRRPFARRCTAHTGADSAPPLTPRGHHPQGLRRPPRARRRAPTTAAQGLRRWSSQRGRPSGTRRPHTTHALFGTSLLLSGHIVTERHANVTPRHIRDVSVTGCDVFVTRRHITVVALAFAVTPPSWWASTAASARCSMREEAVNLLGVSGRGGKSAAARGVWWGGREVLAPYREASDPVELLADALGGANARRRVDAAYHWPSSSSRSACLAQTHRPGSASVPHAPARHMHTVPGGGNGGTRSASRRASAAAGSSRTGRAFFG